MTTYKQIESKLIIKNYYLRSVINEKFFDVSFLKISFMSQNSKWTKVLKLLIKKLLLDILIYKENQTASKKK